MSKWYIEVIKGRNDNVARRISRVEDNAPLKCDPLHVCVLLNGHYQIVGRNRIKRIEVTETSGLLC